jgi:hypothetical protein
LCALWHIAINVGSKWIEWWKAKLTELEFDAFESTVLWSKRPDTGWRARSVARGTAFLFTVLWSGLFLYMVYLLSGCPMMHH